MSASTDKSTLSASAALTLGASDELLALLPERVVELVDVIGLTAALALVEAQGGTHIWVPLNPKPEHWLAGLIGLDAFKRLCAYYSNTQVEIAQCAVLFRRIKHQTIAAEFNQGATNNQLARKYGTTTRTIRRIKQQVKTTEPSPNFDVFNDFL